MNENLQQHEAISRLRRLTLEPSERENLQSDAELLSLYIDGGCRDSIETLIRRYSPMVASVCRLTVSDPASAEDAFQATFLVLLKSAKKIRRLSSVAAWLHGVAYRSASRIRKKRQFQLTQQSCNEVITQCDPTDDPITQLAKHMELEALDRELENLPDRLRAPLVEHYMLGYSAPEIAQRMELSTAAVEGRLRRGRRKLRTLLARRGISLSVLVAGSSLFQEHLVASDAADWSTHFLETHLPQGDGSADESVHADSPNPEISSLVQGELSMISTGFLKTGIAAGILLVAGTFAVIASGQIGPAWGDSGAGTNTSNATVIEAPASDQTVVAQMGGMGMGGMVAPQPTQEQIDAMNKARAEAATIPWQRPETADGTVPIWLSGGQESIQAMEQNRALLAKNIEFEVVDMPIIEVAQELTEKLGVEIEVDVNELDLIGVAPGDLITFRGSGSVREVFRRMLVQYDLTYRVTESTIEITSRDAADADPSTRFYDLAYILPNPSNADAVTNAIQQSLDPDSWLAAGGTSSIVLVGSMMVVSAPDSTHQKIELFLINLAQMNPKNVEKPTPQASFGGGVGGFQGGVGGGGGGMF